MEVEFDNEIDAILRKARSSIAVTKSDAEHLDADVISAFAENALPDKIRLFSVAHLADCERCRKQLSAAIQMNAEFASPAVASLSEPAASTAAPWYQRVFKAPNLALAFGALVLTFGGALGYLLLQQQGSRDSATISQVTDQERSATSSDQSAEPNAAPLEALIATANPTAPPSNMSANTAMPAVRSDGPAEKLAARSESDSKRSRQFQIDGASSSESNLLLDGQETSGAKPDARPAPAAPPSVATDSTAGAELDVKNPSDDRKLKEESKDHDLAKRKQTEDRSYRDMSRPAEKSGRSRAGPVQSQLNQMNTNMPVTRVVGGKTFNSRDGTWYDSVYRGQAPLDFRRGTVEYRKLDSGLRSIADTLGGTVVVVWKSKAYRIQ